jgi:hypothetical protein
MAKLELLGLDAVSDSVLEGRWELDGREYVVRLEWSDRDDSYAINIFTVDRTPVLLGHMPRTGADVFDNVAAEGRPPGKLFLEDTTGADGELLFDGFRQGLRLVYVEAEA